MGRVVVLGIVVLGGLSGFGAVRTAWVFLEHMVRGRTVGEGDIITVERSLFRIRQDIIAKREEINNDESQGETTWVGRFFRGTGASDFAQS